MAHVIVPQEKNIAKTIHTVVLSCSLARSNLKMSTKLVKSILKVSQIAQDFAIKVYVLNTYEVMYELIPICLNALL